MTAFSTRKSNYCTDSAAVGTSVRNRITMGTALLAVSIAIALDISALHT